MNEEQCNVVLFGATGLVGRHVLQLLETDPTVWRIDILTRRKISGTHSAKVFQHLSDLKSQAQIASRLQSTKPNLALCCLGTTIAKAGSQENFYHVDHDLILNAARASKILGVKTFGVISSLGANPKSKNFYLKVKGETEFDLQTLNFVKLVILRPSVLLGEREENRPLEKFLIKTAPLLSTILCGPLKKYRFVEAAVVAKCLIEETRRSTSGTYFIENEMIVKP